MSPKYILEAVVLEAYRAGFIEACTWPAPVRQDVDSVAFDHEFRKWNTRAHLTQPAQAVDAAMAERVLSEYVRLCISHHDDAPADARVEAMRTALTRAIGNAQAPAGDDAASG